jgi:kynurenine formamidase
VPLPAEFLDLAKRVRNWGRWGDDDELGTLNLIDDAAIRRAAACVQTGKAFSLSIPLDGDGPQIGIIPGRFNPIHKVFQVNDIAMPDADPDGTRFSDDSMELALQACTHWDALAHASYGGKLWNGHPADSVTEAGAVRCGIGTVKTLVSRGVLLDIAKLKGVDVIEAGYAFTGDDLDAACDMAGVTVEPGDVVLLRTGAMALFLAGDKIGYAGASGGPSMQTADWFHDHDVAAVATDNMTFEVFPCERDDLLLPVHALHLVDMGLTQGQNWNLEELAADCAADGRYTFVLSATPEPVTGGTGSPVAPVAVK